MFETRSSRAVAGRALLASALVMLVLAALFGADIVPIDSSARGLVAWLLAAVGCADALAGRWFLRSASDKER